MINTTFSLVKNTVVIETGRVKLKSRHYHPQPQSNTMGKIWGGADEEVLNKSLQIK
jgi:hypothetical protein